MSITAINLEGTALCATGIVAVVASVAALLLRGWPVGAAVALGAGLALLNLYWLRAGANAIVYAAVARAPAAVQDPSLLARLGPPAKWGKLRFVGRFALWAGALYAIFVSHFVPFPPVLGGLLAAPAGVMAAVILEAGRGWSRGRPGHSA